MFFLGFFFIRIYIYIFLTIHSYIFEFIRIYSKKNKKSELIRICSNSFVYIQKRNMPIHSYIFEFIRIYSKKNNPNSFVYIPVFDMETLLFLWNLLWLCLCTLKFYPKYFYPKYSK